MTTETAPSDAAGVLASLSNALADTVERAGRSVVRVDAGRRHPGSGVVWDAAGLIVTADHVIEREEDVEIGLPDGTSVGATVAGRDEGSDIALLRAKSGTFAPLARGTEPRTGHLVLAVARPGPTLATSVGVVGAVSATPRAWRGAQGDSLIWTDAAFYPGFGGGALVDAAGSLVGIATSTSRSGAGIAVPVATVEKVVASLQRHGRIKRAFLGIGSQQVELPDTIRSRAGLKQANGLLVTAVEQGGPADKAGIIIGDVLVALAGQPVADHQELLALLGPDRIGQPAPARVIRGGEGHDVVVTVGERG